ncbi:MAG: ribonuclease HII [Candidatus Paceibacterota bacterium]
MKVKNKIKYIVGIDEVGRGPLAGPVAVCAFKMPMDFKVIGFGPLKDSKKLTAQKREDISLKLGILKKAKKVDYSVCYESARKIDKVGISMAIKNCIAKALKNIKAKSDECMVLLDGALRAPSHFSLQKTIIKGDEKERVIAFASIVAKVSRDALMCRLAKKYPKYGFEIHKGYGTQKHCKAIKKHGLSKEHRKCFCKNFI